MRRTPQSPRLSGKDSPRSSPRAKMLTLKNPMSPRLKPPNTTVPQTKVDKVASTFVSITDQNIRVLPPAAKAPGVLSLNLENNNLSEKVFKEIPSTVSSLSLVKNPLVSLGMPRFMNLRTLLLDNCQIKTLEGLPQLPSIRFLSLRNNLLTNLKGAPILAKLESLNISGNSFEFDIRHCLAAFGSISVNRFNGESITPEQLSAAFLFSPLVGYSLRQGRDPTPCETAEEELDKTQKFLSAKLFKHLEDHQEDTETAVLSIQDQPDGSQAVVLPFNSKRVDWYRNHAPDPQGREWQPIPQEVGADENQGILPLTNFIKTHLVKAVFTLDGEEFSLYLGEPIGRIPGDLCLPFPIDPIISGEPHEGSLISLVPLSAPTKVTWVSKEIAIADDINSIIITNREIGAPVTCMLVPYCPNYPTVRFATISTETEEVSPLIPTVTGICFPENVIEGEEITFTRKMFPDREGNSIIKVEHAVSPSAEWTTMAELTPGELSYTPCKEDIGKVLRVSYLPITKEGTEGDTVYFYSKSRVLPTIPVFTNPAIAGIPRAGCPLLAIADYYGGNRGQCGFTWFASKKPIDPSPRGLRRCSEVCQGQRYTPGPDMAGMYIGVQMMPVRDDEVVGDTTFAALPAALDQPLSEDPLDVPGCPDEVVCGRKITFDEPVEFYISDANGFCGFTQVRNAKSWVPKKEHIGHFLRVIKGDCDSIVGEVLPADPEITGLNLSYDRLAVGEQATLVISARRLTIDNVEIIWMKIQGQMVRPIAYNTSMYTFNQSDVGFGIKVRVTPFDHNGRRLPYTETDMTAPIKGTGGVSPVIVGDFVENETLSIECKLPYEDPQWQRKVDGKWTTVGTGDEYQLTRDDIGRGIRLTCRVGGATATVNSLNTVEPAYPSGEVDPNCESPFEGHEIAPIVTYNGGVEGKSEYIWLRYKENDKEQIIANTPTFTPKKEDIGLPLFFRYIPVRRDLYAGDPVEIEYPEVRPALPSVRNLNLIQNKEGNLEVIADYIGGDEGESIILWKKYEEDGTATPLGRTSGRILVPTPQMYGKTVGLDYLPVRADGTKAERRATLPEKKRIVVQPLPSVVEAEVLAKKGELAPGVLLRVRTSTKPANLRCLYQWARGDGEAWTEIEDAHSVEYTPTEDDSGYILQCTVIATNALGWKSQPFAAVTNGAVAYHKPRIALGLQDGEEVSRIDENTKLLTSMTIEAIPETFFDIGEIVWQRLIDGDWIDVDEGATHLLNANDVGHKLRAVADDLVSIETPTVAFNRKSYLNAVVRSRNLKATATSKMGGAVWTITINENGVSMRSKNGNEKTAKHDKVCTEAIEGTVDEMRLTMDVSSNFVLVPQLDDERLKANVGPENIRDFLVCAIRKLGKK